MASAFGKAGTHDTNNEKLKHLFEKHFYNESILKLNLDLSRKKLTKYDYLLLLGKAIKLN